MKASLTNGLDKTREIDVRGSFKASRVFRDRLIEVLNKQIEDKRRASCAESAYENPNFPFKAADNMGFERALRLVISLCEEKSL